MHLQKRDKDMSSTTAVGPEDCGVSSRLFYSHLLTICFIVEMEPLPHTFQWKQCGLCVCPLPMHMVGCFLDFSLPAHVRQVKIAVWLDWLHAPVRELVKYSVVGGCGASFLLKCIMQGSDVYVWGLFIAFHPQHCGGGCMYEGLEVLCQQWTCLLLECVITFQ